MTPAELTTVKIGDVVRSHHHVGQVTRETSRWFMIMWETGTPEVISRTFSCSNADLVLETVQPKLTYYVPREERPNRRQRREHLQPAPAAPIRAYKD